MDTDNKTRVNPDRKAGETSPPNDAASLRSDSTEVMTDETRVAQRTEVFEEPDTFSTASGGNTVAALIPGYMLKDRFKLGDKLGQGGMGAVYEGHHMRIKRRVAIKVLTASGDESLHAIERFEREAQALRLEWESGAISEQTYRQDLEALRNKFLSSRGDPPDDP